MSHRASISWTKGAVLAPTISRERDSGARAISAPGEPSARLSRSARGEHRVDLRLAEARLAQHFQAVLAQARLKASNVARRLAVGRGDVGHAQRALGRVLHGLPEARRLELRVGEERLQRVDDGGGHVGALERLQPLRGVASGHDLAQLLVERLDVGEARLQRREARIGEKVRAPRDLEEGPPVGVRIGHHGEEAVLGLEGTPPTGEDPLVARALDGRDEGLAVEMLHHHVGDHALHHGYLHGLAFARPLAMHEGGQYRGEHGERAGLVGHDGGHVTRLAHHGGLQHRESGGGLDHVVVGGLLPIGAARAEAVGRHVDEARVDDAERLVVQAEPRGGGRTEIVKHHVGARGELEKRGAARGLLEVEDHAALVAIAGEEEGAHARIARGTQATRRVAFRRLHLDDVGAQVAQGLGRPGSENDRGHVEHPHAVERSGHERPRVKESGRRGHRKPLAVDRRGGCGDNGRRPSTHPHDGVPSLEETMDRMLDRRSILKLGAAGAAALSARLSVAHAQEKPKRGGTITIGRNHDADTLYPGRSTGLSAIATNMLLYDGLVLHDFQMKIRPALAERWEVSPDGLTWTFYLKKGVKFHCGAPLTAQDVKDHFDRWIDPKEAFPTRAKVASLAETKVVDDTTLVCRLKNPTLVFLNNVSQTEWSYAAIPHAKHVAQHGQDYGVVPGSVCGTGPFRLKEWTKDDRMELVRHEGYTWGSPAYDNTGVPWVDRVVFRTLPEDAARAAELETGGIDLDVDV